MSKGLVFVVYQNLGYEGCSKPLRAFSTEALANLFMAGSELHTSSLECVALEVQEPEDFKDTPPQPITSINS